MEKSTKILLGTNLLVAVTILLLKNNLPVEVPIFYGLPEGTKQLGQWWQLIFPPFLSSFIILTNFFLEKKIHNLFLQKVLLITGGVATGLGIITVVKIIFQIASF